MAGVCQINHDFVVWKVLYFLAAAGQGPYVFFLVNFYITRGLTYEEAGYIESIVPFLGCIFRPLSCYLADRFSLHRSLLATSVFIYALSLMGFVVLSTRRDLIVPSANSSALGTEIANNTVLDVTLTANSNSPAYVTPSFVFPVMCGLRFLSTLGITPATSLLDGIVYHSLESKGQSANWGRQRLWGSIGFSIAVLLSSFLLDMFTGINFVIGFSIALGGTLIWFIISLVSVTSYETGSASLVERKATDSAEVEKELMSSSNNAQFPVTENHFAYVIRFIFRDGQVLLVLVVAAAVGYLTACRDIFVSQYLESITRSDNKRIMGVMQAIVGSLEIPVMFTVGWFFQKFGTMFFFAACFAAFSLRFFFYTVLTAETIWLFLLIELLHLFCFGFVVPAFTLHAHRRISKERQRVVFDMATTMQGLVSALYLGLGYGIGSIVGGILTQRFGGVSCMLIFSKTGIACFFVFCVVWLIMVIVSRRRANKKDKKDEPSQPLNDLNQQNDNAVEQS